MQVIIWSPRSRRAVATLKGHGGAVHGVIVDRGDGNGQSARWIASGGGEGSLFIWDPRNFDRPVQTLLGEDETGSGYEDGVWRGGMAARRRGESGRWEGDTTGATMLNSVNCLVATGGSQREEWLFAAGETVVRAWRLNAGVWEGGEQLPGSGLGGIASLSMLE